MCTHFNLRKHFVHLLKLISASSVVISIPSELNPLLAMNVNKRDGNKQSICHSGLLIKAKMTFKAFSEFD